MRIDTIISILLYHARGQKSIYIEDFLSIKMRIYTQISQVTYFLPLSALLIYYSIRQIYFATLSFEILHCFPTLNASISPLCTSRRAVFFPMCRSSCNSFNVNISLVLLSIVTRSFSVCLIPCSHRKAAPHRGILYRCEEVIR